MCHATSAAGTSSTGGARVMAERSPLFVPLAGAPWAAFNVGSKTVEVRQDAPRWGPKHVFEGRPVLLRRGYSTTDEIVGTVGRVYRGFVSVAPEWVRAGAAIADWYASPCFDSSRRIVAFEVVR